MKERMPDRMDQAQSRNRTVLITGASSGIGKELAILFAKNHYDLIIVSRTRETLELLAQQLHHDYLVSVEVQVCDLTERDSVEKLIRSLEDRNQVIDVLVNNAGFGLEGKFSEMNPSEVSELITLNVATVVRLTRAVLPQMVLRRSGKILQVSSTAGFQPGPNYAVYFASKAFLNSFSQSVALELKGTGVTMTVFCPGPTRTRFEKRLGFNSKLFNTGLPIADPKKIAEAAYQALFKGKVVAVPGILNWTLSVASRVLPASWVRFIVNRLLN